MLKDDWDRLHQLIAPEELPEVFRGTRDWGPVRGEEAKAQGEWEKHHSTFEELGIDPKRAGCSDRDSPPWESLEDVPVSAGLGSLLWCLWLTLSGGHCGGSVWCSETFEDLVTRWFNSSRGCISQFKTARPFWPSKVPLN